MVEDMDASTSLSGLRLNDHQHVEAERLLFATSQGPERGEMGKKLNRPRVDSYVSPDGSGSLTYAGLDHSHDMGGSNYRFVYHDGDGEVAISARVKSILRANHAAEAQGIDLWSMTLEESEYFEQSYYEQNPRDYQVIRFYASEKGKDFDRTAAARFFCDLFLELNASYRFNDTDYPAKGDGYYWERVFFQPYDADPKNHFQQSVGTPQ